MPVAPVRTHVAGSQTNSGADGVELAARAWLSYGVLVSVGAHAALAAALFAQPELLGSAAERSEASSANRVVTLVIDSGRTFH